jgi:hypothetical protein
MLVAVCDMPYDLAVKTPKKVAQMKNLFLLKSMKRIGPRAQLD